MKRIIVIGVCFLNLVSVFSQVYVGPSKTNKAKNFGNKYFEDFKKTTTIFVLSNIFKKEEYEKILKETWTVTPFKVVNYNDFDISNYLNGKYSISQLTGFKRIKTKESGLTSTSVYLSLDTRIYDTETISKKLGKLTPKKMKKKFSDIIRENSKLISKIRFYSKDEFTAKVLKWKMDEIVNSLYTEKVFFNYNLGFLKNYFQKMNSQFGKKELFLIYNEFASLELSKLKEQKLYIPEYIGVKYNGWIGQDSEADNENIDNIFKNYNFEYEIISDKLLDESILRGDDVYYLRYTRENAERFVRIVNAKTGEIIYKKYMTGLSYKLQAKHIDGLNKAIKKAIKKSSKK